MMDIHPVTFISMIILSIFSYSLLRTDINYEIPRPITWLDMLGAYIMTIFITLFLNGFLNSGYTGTIYSFPTLIMDYGINSFVGVSPYFHEPIFLPHVLFGFILCFIFIYCYITAILKIPFIDEIPYTDNSKMNTLFGFHYERLRLYIIISFIISTLFCIGYFIGYILSISIIGGLAFLINRIIYSIFFYSYSLIADLLVELLFIDFIYDNIGSYDIYINYSRSIGILILISILYILSGIEQIIRNSDHYDRFKQLDIVKYSLSHYNSKILIKFFLIFILILIFISSFYGVGTYYFQDIIIMHSGPTYTFILVTILVIVLIQYFLGLVHYMLEQTLGFEIKLKNSNLDPIYHIKLVILLVHFSFLLIFYPVLILF